MIFSHFGARGCKMTIYYAQNKLEIIQSAYKLLVSPHNHNNFSTAGDNKSKMQNDKINVQK